MISRVSCGLTAAALFVVGISHTLAETRYTLVDLGSGEAKDINASGKVVGNADTGGWFYDGTNRTTVKFSARFLGGSADQLLFFTSLTANGINDNGRIVGSIMFVPLTPETQTPYFIDPGQNAVLLAQGDAFGVNSGGMIVGGNATAFTFNGTTTVTTQPGPSPQLFAVNDSGVSAGSVLASGNQVAARFSGNTHTVLNLNDLTLPPLGVGAVYESIGRSINGAGEIVGQVKLKTAAAVPKPSYGFLFSGNKATGLGSLGGITTIANDINASGKVVGTATIEDDSPHAFIFEGDEIADLNLRVNGAFGWILNSANAINNDGLIVGEGLKNGQQHAFMLKPVADNQPPAISAQPQSTSVFFNNGFTLSVTATGGAPLSYQWRHANTNLPGATARTLTVASAAAIHAGKYQVVVTNPFGSTPSQEVTVQVQTQAVEVPTLDLKFYAGITVTGTPGQKLRIEGMNEPGSDIWTPLNTITLESTSFFWVDPNSPVHTRRVYRAVEVP